jgi:hypothetical protein
MNASRQILAFLFLFTFAAGLGAVVTQNIAKGYLRKHHPDIWHSLGQPGFLRNSIYSSMKFGRYAMQGSHYRALNDKKMNRLVSMARAFGLVAGISLALTMGFAYVTHTTH